MTRLYVGPAGGRILLRLYGGAAVQGRPVLLCLHGFTGSGRTWRPFRRAFAARFRPVAADAPGHGGSDAPSEPAAYGMWRTADLLAEAVDRLGAGRAHVLGYSMGGRLALHLALAHPDRVASLVLEGASPGIEDEGERARRQAADQAWARLLLEDGLEEFVARWEAQPLFASLAALPERRRRALRRERLGQRPLGLAMSLLGAGAGVQDDLWPRLGEVRVPLLYVAGGLDARYAAVGERVARAVPDGRLCVVPGAGHAAHLERPRAFARALEAFWRSIGAGAPAQSARSSDHAAGG
jgi:2-succinyl-6-hydroxy-2,4-cyclohexadiene-1-carboxylate synthase